MIPVNEPLLGDEELENVIECVRTGWVSSAGRFINELEERWATYCGRAHGVAVCNGTAALQVAIAALELEPGDEVILPSFTIISCATAVIYAGGTPVFVDCTPDTWTLDTEQVAAAVTERTRAIMPVHIYGHPAEMAPILRLAEVRGLAVIEDAAEAHGAEVREGEGEGGTWRRCGSFGEMSAFSFYANKLVTTGEGGMVLTDDAALAEKLRSLRDLCFQQPRFVHEALGFNFRMSNLAAALGVAQVARIDEVVARKREVARRYREGLEGIAGLQLPVERDGFRSVYWMYGVVLDEGMDLDAKGLAERLAQRDVQTRPFFWGLHQQPAFTGFPWYSRQSLPVTERIAQRGLYLPSGVALRDEDVETVCARVREVLG